MRNECLRLLGFIIVGCLVICSVVYATVYIMDIFRFLMEVV